MRPPPARFTRGRALPLSLLFATLAILALAVFAFRSSAAGPDSANASQQSPPIDLAERNKVAAAYGKLPLSFEKNLGQTDSRVQFIAHGVGYDLFLTTNEAVLALPSYVAAGQKGAGSPAQKGRRVLRLKLVGPNLKSEAVGLDELPGKFNYFIGNDASKWITDAPLYSRAQFRNVYEGVDLIYYGNQSELEFDFHVAAGADPRAIKLEFEGADRVKLDKKDGSVVLAVDAREVRLKAPLIYQQQADGERREVKGGYAVKGKTVQFRVTDFDASKPLVIDPILSYSTFLGTGATGWGIAVDSSGSAYATGQTGQLTFPTTGVNFIPVNSSFHAFVTKLDPSGSSLVYSTLIGGSSGSMGFALAIDSAGAASITGRTSSNDFPTVNAVRANTNLVKSVDNGGTWTASNSGLGNLAVIDLAVDPSVPSTIYAAVSGGAGVYKTSDGGGTWSALNTGATFVTALAVDPQTPATVYATVNAPFFGAIKSIDAGATWNQINTGLSGGFVYAVAVNPQTPATIYAGTNSGVFKSTNGGSNWQLSNTGLNFGGVSSIAIDPSAPTTIYAAAGGGGVFKSINSGGNWTQMNTGLTNTTVSALLVDPTNTSTVYAGTAGGGIFKTSNGAGNWSPVNTGLSVTSVRALAYDALGAAIYAGTSKSSVFKSVNGGGSWAKVYSALSGPAVETLAVAGSNVYAGVDTRLSQIDNEAFVTKLNPNGNALVFSTYLGGSANEDGLGIATDSAGNVVVAGYTESADFTVANALQANLNGTMDAFVTKFTPTGTLFYSTYLGGASGETGRGVAVDSSGNAYVAGTTFSTNFPTTPGAFRTTLANGQFLSDAFVTKIDPAGSQYLYSTYLGGNDGDSAFAVAVDTTGNAIVAGSSSSSNFPLVNPIQPITQNFSGVFVSKLNTIGSALVYSSFLGGDSHDQARGIAVDPSGNAYVTGITRSSGFPTTPGALNTRSGFYQTTTGGATWSNDTSGLVVPLQDIAQHPTSLVIFASTNDAGVYKSNNLGLTWIPANNGLTNLRVNVLAIDPTTPDTMYVGGGNSGGGIFKTTDAGASWSSVNGNQPFTNIAAIAIDPVSPTTIYASTVSLCFKTTNGGTTWNPIGSGQLSSSITSLAIDPQNTQIVYATSNSTPRGVLKSTDGGATWNAINNGLDAFANRVVIDPSNSSTLYVGTDIGVFKSVNSGASWTNVLGVKFVSNLTIDPASPATVYAMSFFASSTGTAVSRSFNGGANWTAIGSRTINTAGRLLINPQATNTLYVIANSRSLDDDAFVSKLTPAGNLAYSTYLGGSLSDPGGTPNDQALAIAADATGNAYVTGLATSLDFPVTPNAYQPFGRSAFITKLSPSFTISGVVTDSGATPQSGVKVTLSGSATDSRVTGVDGTYAFTNLQPGGNYTVSATKTGFSFAPPSQNFSNLNADQTANFTLLPSATPSHTISGRIAEADNTAIPAVTVSLAGSQIEFATTNSTGNYSFSAPDGGNYTVTPSALGFVFSPSSQSVNNLSANTTLNFTGTRQDFVVTNTNDHGAGSLQQAITNANVTFGADRIVFQIPGPGVQTIRPVSPLPEITDQVTIDGTTQPGFSGSLLIELDGSGTGSSSSGLTISGGNSTVRGLVINRFAESGITLKTGGGNHIEGNIIGLDPTGTIKRQNVVGISINASSGNVIGGVTTAQRNVISGNSANGIGIVAAGNQIKGNYIGTNAAGTAALGNGFGILISNLSGQPSPDANQIGGTELGARNLISGNSAGIDTSGNGTVIQGNLIGTDVSGTTKIGNEMFGVKIQVSGVILGGTTAAARNIISGNGTGVTVSMFGINPTITLKGNYIGTDISGTAKLGNFNGVFFAGTGIIGGTEPGAGNLISGNDGPGIQLNCCNPGITTVQGNLIGTDATGLLPLGNGSGIHAESSQNIIGGPQAGARNVISGNSVGVQIGGLSFPGPFANVVQGNYIGVNALGNAPLGNTSRGIELNESSNSIIGGDQPGERNVLAFNSVGVIASTSVRNSLIKGNSIFSNSGLGVDLNSDGIVTPNDPGDADTGANLSQNFPVLSSIARGSGDTSVKGSLNSVPNTQYRIDFYSNLACDGSGNGEGAVPFGFTTTATGADGNSSFDVILVGQLAANRTLTATATDPAGNTSEFSPCNASATAGSLEFGAFDFNVREDVGNAVVRVVRTGGSKGSLTVNYATNQGTATAGLDYADTSGSFTFADGETEKTFNVPIVNDGATEPEETVRLSLTGFTDLESAGAKYRATLHIFDSNTPLTISGSDAQIVEGDIGQRNVIVPVTLSAANSQTVTVNYATASGGSSALATSGRDFLPVSGTLTFAPGVETQNISVPILADTLDEFDETFVVSLNGAVNATVVRASIVKIFDDDPMPTLSVTDVSVVEAPGATAVFSVRLSAPSGRTVQLNYSTANGTATAGIDYSSTSSFLSFAAGQTVQQVSVSILTDGTAEPDETFLLNLANPLRATIADGQGVGTIIDASASTTLISFSAPTYAVNEGDGQVQITVTRTGSTASESSVYYKTIGQTASDRSDFTPSFGRLRFAAGETSKTFNVLITDDAFLESAESLDLELSDPVGAALGGPNVAGLTITSNDAADGPNPISDSTFFVRQHYHDFLSREPDAGGLAFWVDQIESCGSDIGCREIRRINVSAAFFLAIEFQETGYFAYRVYKSAYGDSTSPNVAGTVPIIRLQEFLPDSQQIGFGVQVGIGNWQQQLEDNKNFYALGFVQTPRFIASYPLSMTAEQFVNKLDLHAGGVLSADEKAQLIATLEATPADAAKRASVLRSVADDNDLKQRELNRAFVLMQFYGYLRRNPDDPQDTDFRGWKFWLDKLNQFNGNFVEAEMVKSFLVSGEYRQRFGTP